MKAAAIQWVGGPEGLAVRNLLDRTPASGEVLISTEAIGVGFRHVLIRSGAVTVRGMENGHILGGELAGTVSAVGDDIDPSWIGQRVWAFVTSGGYADKACRGARGITS